MIRKLVFIAVALSGSGAALAADLPSRAAPPPYYAPPPVFTWTGAYVGGQVGYAFGRTGAFSRTTVPTTVYGAYNPNGVVGGAHVGYNYQIGMFVAGLEGDVNGSGDNGSFVSSNVPGTTLGTRIGVDGSVRGRVGLAWDRALVYATGGAAFAGINNTYNTPGGFTSLDHSRTGWTVGGGVEYAFSNNWSLRAEYRYSDYGRYTDLPTGTVTPVTNHVTEQRVQAGFSYKFDMFGLPGATLAKY